MVLLWDAWMAHRWGGGGAGISSTGWMPAGPHLGHAFVGSVDQGVDLRHYSRQIEKDLKSIEQLSIGDCKFAQTAARPHTEALGAYVPGT